jgi:hypothetical protein
MLHYSVVESHHEMDYAATGLNRDFRNKQISHYTKKVS